MAARFCSKRPPRCESERSLVAAGRTAPAVLATSPANVFMHFDRIGGSDLRLCYTTGAYLSCATHDNMTRRQEGAEAMITVKGWVGGAIVLWASVAVTGCASQSDAFRQMSAADHESAARTDPG